MDETTANDIAPRGEKIFLEKERFLIYRAYDLRCIFEKYGSIGDIMIAFQNLQGLGAMDFGVKELQMIADIVAYGLQHEENPVDSDYVLKHASMGDFVEYAQAMSKALIASLPKPKQNP